MSETDDLIAEVREILKAPEFIPFRPVVLLKLVLVLAERVQELEGHRHQVSYNPYNTTKPFTSGPIGKPRLISSEEKITSITVEKDEKI